METIDPIVTLIIIFVLACMVVYYVIWGVTSALHSPLMAVTNAISSVIIVGAIIAAKPEQRRSLLEEAAGITGLHSRRHEAELRLNSTENNLERVKDVLEAQDEQLQSLKKQSKQAERYKNIQKDITRARATLFYQKWQVEKNKLEELEKLVSLGKIDPINAAKELFKLL